jgi:hypothetical protein
VARDAQPAGELVRGQRRRGGIERGEDLMRIGSSVALRAIASAESGSFGFFL